jgi:hypothetical protein
MKRFATILGLAMAASAGAAPLPSLMGEWQAEAPPPHLRSFRRVLFAPTAMILDDRQALAVRGYDAIDGAIRVRTDGAGDLLFVLDGERLCLAGTGGVQALPSAPVVTASERCFIRRVPTSL